MNTENDEQRLDFKLIEKQHSGGHIEAAIVPIPLSGVTEQGLRELFERIVDEQLLSENDQKYELYNLFAYTGVDEYTQRLGGWIGHYFNVPKDRTPQFQTLRLETLSTTESEKMGLSERRRRDIFIAIDKNGYSEGTAKDQNINIEQLKEIRDEGIKKSWPSVRHN